MSGQFVQSHHHPTSQAVPFGGIVTNDQWRNKTHVEASSFSDREETSSVRSLQFYLQYYDANVSENGAKITPFLLHPLHE
jgi:hypothetical protein